MSELESLPADQRAAVQLLLKQGQSYADLADLLATDEASVRRRAHSALESLGPDTGTRLSPTLREEVSDYLLGQQTVGEREATRELLADSPEARAWARSVAGSLRPVAPDAVPDVPEGRPAREADTDEEETAPYAALPGEPRQGSRLGGALLLGGVAIVIAVVVILLTSGGDDKKPTATTPTATTMTPSTQTSTQTQTQAGGEQLLAQIPLAPPGGGNSPEGIAGIFRRANQVQLVVGARKVRPGVYALWLYNSPSSSKLLGFVPTPVGRDGQFRTAGPLPGDAGRYKQVIVTSERPTSQRQPTRPGRIVLQGALNLGGG